MAALGIHSIAFKNRGLVLLLKPLGATTAVCSMVGIVLLILGIFGLLNRFVFHAEMVGSIELGINIIEALAGFYILFHPGSIIKFTFLILAVVALTKPFESTALLLRVIGASLLFDGITDLFIVHKTSQILRKEREKAEPIDVDAKIK